MCRPPLFVDIFRSVKNRVPALVFIYRLRQPPETGAFARAPQRGRLGGSQERRSTLIVPRDRGLTVGDHRKLRRTTLGSVAEGHRRNAQKPPKSSVEFRKIAKARIECHLAYRGV